VAIPTYDALMLPVLRHCAEKTWLMRNLIDQIADDLDLDQGERTAQLPSGGTTIIASRVHWAKTYLKQAGLVEQPKRGVVQISPRGREVLASSPTRIDNALLHRFPEFQSFLSRTRGDNGQVAPASTVAVSTSLPLPAVPASTPEEQITAASRILNEALRDALLARILEGSPVFFEKLIIDLLLAMGYGGSRSEAGEQLGGTGDGGRRWCYPRGSARP
jgi:restriction system protein